VNISTQSWIALTYFIASLVNPTCCDAQVRNDLQPPPSAEDEADRKRVGESLMLVKIHKPQDAIDELNPVISNYQERNKNTRPYCSRSLQESVLYMAHAAEDKTSAAIVNHVWCDALYVKAYTSVDLGQLENAETSLKEVIAMAPSNAPSLNANDAIATRELDYVRGLKGR
jgi:Flp pilus assembly protein TadD